jgi:hypothetical protein
VKLSELHDSKTSFEDKMEWTIEELKLFPRCTLLATVLNEKRKENIANEVYLFI